MTAANVFCAPWFGVFLAALCSLESAAALAQGDLARAYRVIAGKTFVDQAEAKQIEQVGQEAATNYGVSGTPTFVVHGQSQTHGPFVDFQELKNYIDPILAKKK